MTEYIKREDAIDAVLDTYYNTPDIDLSGERLEAAILNIPAADVVEVVRCRECVHWKPIGSKAGNSFSDMEYIGGCEFTKYCRRESDFCSYGERKGGAD